MDKFDIIFSSDLKRAVNTAELAFGGRGAKFIEDVRLRNVIMES